jgi:hypothetical protein
MSRAIASRAEKGTPSDQRSRKVAITDVLRYSSLRSQEIASQPGEDGVIPC